MKRFKSAINRMAVAIMTADSRPLESSLAAAETSLGLWLILPYSTFQSSTAFAVMQQVAGEDAWGVVILAIGFAHFLAIHSRSLKLRRFANRVSLLAWLFVDASIWLALSDSTAGIIFFVFVLMAIWSNLTTSFRRDLWAN